MTARLMQLTRPSLALAACGASLFLLAGCAAPRETSVPVDWSLLVQQVGPSGVPIESIRVESAGDVRKAIGAGPLMVVARADSRALQQLAAISRPFFDDEAALLAQQQAVDMGESGTMGEGNATLSEAAGEVESRAERRRDAGLSLKGIRRANGALRQRWLRGDQAALLWSRLRALTNPTSQDAAASKIDVAAPQARGAVTP